MAVCEFGILTGLLLHTENGTAEILGDTRVWWWIEGQQSGVLLTSELEEAIQKRLTSTHNQSVISLPTNVFKHVFGQESDFLAEKEDFSKLPLSSHWYFKLNVHGQGVKLSFPVRVKCIVKNKKLYLPVCSVSTLKVFPVEKLVLISATTVCTIDNCWTCVWNVPILVLRLSYNASK